MTLNTLNKLLKKNIVSFQEISRNKENKFYRVECSEKSYFLKIYNKIGQSLCEVNGLKEICKTGAILTPRIIDYSKDYILFDYVNTQKQNYSSQKKLGESIANLHKTTSDRYGFYENNYIGSIDQVNSYNSSWTSFYIKNRLDYQVNLAESNRFYSIKESYSKLRPIIPEILKQSIESPTLMHGDLWYGNVLFNSQGEPIIIDPAVYYGNRELELAMTKLFGGFSNDFYDSYNKTYPLIKGWQEREKLYQLYHILNHLNMFGSSYLDQGFSCINYYLR